MPNILSNADIAVLETLRYSRKRDSNLLGEADLLLVPPQILRTLRPSLDPGTETMMASGMATLQTWRAPGDGSYQVSHVPIALTGFANKTGVKFAAGVTAGSLAMNAFNKHRAQVDSQPRWMGEAYGPLTVSTSGFYIEDQQGGRLLRWRWDSFESIEWKGQSNIDLLISDEGRNLRLHLNSDWAELILSNWIYICFPQHPGRYSWFQPDWVERVRANLGIDPFTEPLTPRALPF
jgi:hypothetical protein